MFVQKSDTTVAGNIVYYSNYVKWIRDFTRKMEYDTMEVHYIASAVEGDIVYQQAYAYVDKTIVVLTCVRGKEQIILCVASLNCVCQNIPALPVAFAEIFEKRKKKTLLKHTGNKIEAGEYEHRLSLEEIDGSMNLKSPASIFGKIREEFYYDNDLSSGFLENYFIDTLFFKIKYYDKEVLPFDVIDCDLFLLGYTACSFRLGLDLSLYGVKIASMAQELLYIRDGKIARIKDVAPAMYKLLEESYK